MNQIIEYEEECNINSNKYTSVDMMLECMEVVNSDECEE